MKRPSFQFYPADWLRDTALRTCSVGARGLWMDMLCFMHEGNPYGTLKVGNKVILPANLAAMIGATLPEVEGWLSELESAGTFDRGEDGAIQSRRMIRDEYLRTVRAAGGKLGGNPALKDNGKVGGRLTSKDKQKPTPSSSSSPSSSRFIPPSVEEVGQYGHSLNPPFLDADKFVNFYESKGWKIGKNPMKNWKAAIRTWQSNTDAKTTSTGTRPLF